MRGAIQTGTEVTWTSTSTGIPISTTTLTVRNTSSNIRVKVRQARASGNIIQSTERVLLTGTRGQHSDLDNHQPDPWKQEGIPVGTVTEEVPTEAAEVIPAGPAALSAEDVTAPSVVQAAETSNVARVTVDSQVVKAAHRAEAGAAVFPAAEALVVHAEAASVEVVHVVGVALVVAEAVVAVAEAAGKFENIANSLSLKLKSRKLYKGGKE
jgi:hypothetical protein